MCPSVRPSIGPSVGPSEGPLSLFENALRAHLMASIGSCFYGIYALNSCSIDSLCHVPLSYIQKQQSVTGVTGAPGSFLLTDD